jgi:hypothetical protein
VSVWCFLVINVCNHAEHHETPCIMLQYRKVNALLTKETDTHCRCHKRRKLNLQLNDNEAAG